MGYKELMRLFFLSDLHLRSGQEESALRFVRFLGELPKAGDTLVLGGDIFDLFVGSKAVFRERHRLVLTALREAVARGVGLHYLEGNHDFHLEKLFKHQAGAYLHADEFGLDFAGTRVFISHGDLIDPEDRGYRLLRSATRHPLFRLFLALLPGAAVAGIGSASSKESRKYNHEETGGNQGQQRLRALYRAFAESKVAEGYRHVLVGHSHLADQVPLAVGEKAGEYVNLGFSSRALPYAVLEAGASRFECRNYP